MKTVTGLKALQEQSVLRLNCPGFGASSLLTSGQARPLVEYKVIIVNPISIVHLFEQDAALIGQIEMAQAEGLTSYRVPGDKIIERISQQIEVRSPELFQFLAEGGLLIYYLCRPFVIHSENRSMDNYAWLCGLAPDQSGESTVSEQAVRHMSTVAHGRNIDKCEAASESEFEKYLEQVGLEWNTIIRTDFLTSGYTPLAEAGPKKCIAGELIAGDNGGRVVFLPAPYSPDFDRILIDCINLWYSIKSGFRPTASTDSSSKLNGERNGGTAVQPQLASNQSEKSKKDTETTADIEVVPSIQSLGTQSLGVDVSTRTSDERISASDFGVPRDIDQAQIDDENPDEAQHPFRLNKDIDELASMADWCKSYWLPGMDNIFKDIQAIRKQIKELENRLVTSEQTISALEEVKATLLSGRPGDITAGCKVVLEALGWNVEPNGSSELVLAENGRPLAVVRIAVTLTTPERSELARLTESLINFWDNQGVEPKGVLIACTFCDTPLTRRKEPDFSEILLDFAAKKNICLISTTQLISIYLHIKLGKINPENVRTSVLSTAGVLSGFSL